MKSALSDGSRLPGAPLIYLITDGEATDANFDVAKRRIVADIAAAVELGVTLVQIREKSLSARLLFELTSSAVEATRGPGARVLVNDRADVAFAAGADGVHLTARSLGADVIRRSFPPEFIVGVSTHSVGEVVAARESGADFVVYGPVFATPGKGEGQGSEALQNACIAVAPLPVLALGGIDTTNVDVVLRAGASGVAGIRAFKNVDSIRRLIDKLND